MHKLIEEYIENHPKGEDVAREELQEAFSEYGAPADWEFVKCEMTDYDEGYVYYDSVLKHKPTGRFFKGTHTYESWEGGEQTDLDEVVEVFAVERMVTFYEEKK